LDRGGDKVSDIFGNFNRVFFAKHFWVTHRGFNGIDKVIFIIFFLKYKPFFKVGAKFKVKKILNRKFGQIKKVYDREFFEIVLDGKKVKCGGFFFLALVK
jgi:hypothetical protein